MDDGPGGDAVEDVGAELPLNDTVNAMAAATTRTATVMTALINQRSGRTGGDGASPRGGAGRASKDGAGGRRPSWRGAASSGRVGA